MQRELNSEGKCLLCGEKFTKADINKHLSIHLEEISKSKKTGQSFLVNVETNKRWGTSPYFLSLWVDGETTMKIIDKFLRDIWLECCGHLSRFNSAGMAKQARDVFKKGVRIDYEYDFGSSTSLTLTCINEYPVKADKKIVLLSRNEPLQIMCDICKKVPATQICAICIFEEDSKFCDKCAEKHAEKCEDFNDYAAMPIVNSPRTGVCGYVGGTIDVERDGVYKK